MGGGRRAGDGIAAGVEIVFVEAVVDDDDAAELSNDGAGRPLLRSIRRRLATFRAAAWGPVWKPRLVSAWSDPFHRRQPSKSISAWGGLARVDVGERDSPAYNPTQPSSSPAT